MTTSPSSGSRRQQPPGPCALARGSTAQLGGIRRVVAQARAQAVHQSEPDLWMDGAVDGGGDRVVDGAVE